MEHLRESKGVIHVHTAYSDSSARMPEVVACARKVGLDYVVVADHARAQARSEGWEGWHDGVLVVAGLEVTSFKGHAVVLGLDGCPRWTHTHPDEYLPQVARLGGTAFVAHPERTHRGKLYRKPQIWPDLRTDCYAGVEIWSYMHDWVEWAYPWRLVSALGDPDTGIAGPHPAVLEAWDRVALRRHCSGIGALDAHEYRLPVPKFRWSLLRVLPTEYVFGTVRTHVLTPEWSGDAATDVAALEAALVAGRCFTAYDLVGESDGARFTASRGDETAVVGDEIAAGSEVEFRAVAPDEAEITLRRNSEVVARASARELVHRDARPGVYRIEARRFNRPWIFTNHIYIR